MHLQTNKQNRWGQKHIRTNKTFGGDRSTYKQTIQKRGKEAQSQNTNKRKNRLNAFSFIMLDVQ